MRLSSARPLGVSVIALLVAINGLAALATALDLLGLDLTSQAHADEPAAGVQLVGGLLLLVRAVGLWRLNLLPWLATLALLAFDGATDFVELVRGTPTACVWLSLVVAVGTALYLLTPRVRAAFVRERPRG
jgi:uncharacterized membrane protein (DUF2068 family)